MSRILNHEFIERLLFTAIVIGILMLIFGGIQFTSLTYQLSNNEAAQIHSSGEEISPETNSEVRGLVASDMERRRLVNQRFNMMVVGGVGLALIGGGWIIMDILRGRRKNQDESAVQSVAEAISS